MDTITPTSKNPLAKPSTPRLGQSELLEWFRYEPDTGKFYWRKRPERGGGFRKVGDEAGSLNANGRRVLWLKGRRIYAGRAGWIMSNGDIPYDVLIDHIDGDTLNDRLDNLRIASSVQNTWNRIGRSSGAKGVAKDVRGRYKARITLSGDKINLGTWDTEAEAHAAYMGAAAVIHGEFWLGNRDQKQAADAVSKRRA